MTMLKFTIVILFSTLFLSDTSGQVAIVSTIAQADSLYASGAYKEALIAYQKAQLQGVTDPDLYFNMGAAASQTGDVALSIYYFENALRYDHHDKSLHDAIKDERSKIANGVVPIDPFFLKNWIYNLLTLLRPATWAWIGCVFLFLALIRWWQQQRIISDVKIVSRLPVMLYLFCGLLFLLIAVLSYRNIYRANEAIIFHDCDFREAPSNDSPLTRQLHAGEKVVIRDELAEYYKVDLLNLDQGWIRKECLRIIRPGKV